MMRELKPHIIANDFYIRKWRNNELVVDTIIVVKVSKSKQNSKWISTIDLVRLVSTN